jgi:mRNA-degrading endonuclease YafQ of YafQ-DinJ toxin-antitoxin module
MYAMLLNKRINKMTDTQITIRCSNQFRKKVQSHAKKNNVSVSELGRDLFTLLMENQLTIKKKQSLEAFLNQSEQAS